MDSTNIYAYISIIALFVCLPPAIIVSTQKLKHIVYGLRSFFFYYSRALMSAFCCSFCVIIPGWGSSTHQAWFQWCHYESGANQIRIWPLLGGNVLPSLQPGLHLASLMSFLCFNDLKYWKTFSKENVLLLFVLQLATNTLERVAPLTHAVGNVLKRVFVIGFSIIIFGKHHFRTIYSTFLF